MQTYPMFNKEGARSPIFQLQSAFIGITTIARLLAAVDGVSDVQRRKAFAKSSDIHVEFKYLGRPYIVWEPFGDNSRYWIGPADMVAGAPDVAKLDRPEDIANLENAFQQYQPSLPIRIIGNLVSLNFKGLFSRG